jgi:hypothetical protein
VSSFPAGVIKSGNNKPFSHMLFIAFRRSTWISLLHIPGSKWISPGVTQDLKEINRALHKSKGGQRQRSRFAPEGTPHQGPEKGVARPGGLS